MRERRGVYRILVGKPEGKRPLKIDFQEMTCGGMDWIELAQDRDRWRVFLNTAMNIRVP
jgi:hypothetical protein